MAKDPIGFIVTVNVNNRATKERIRHKVLYLSSDLDAIAASVEALFGGEGKKYKIANVQAIAKPVHVLHTLIHQYDEEDGPYINRGNGTERVFQPTSVPDEFKCYAIGLATTMPGADESHAIRRLARALAVQSGSLPDQKGPRLSHDATLTIEEVTPSSGYSRGRDVSAEVNKAHIVRG